MTTNSAELAKFFDMSDTVNSKVSWQAKVLNELVLRPLVKPKLAQMEKPTNFAHLRELAAKVDRFFARKVRDVNVETIDIEGVSCTWLAQPSSKQPNIKLAAQRVILYLHGGGFCVHLPNIYTNFAANLAKRLNANVLMPDYRLAPENPFPACIEDCVSCYKWLLVQGYQASNIIIAGDSAGGYLTLSTLIGARDAGLLLPAVGLLMSPASDFTEQGVAAMATNAGQDPIFSPASLVNLLEECKPDHIVQNDPSFSPAVSDLSGLPPLQCHVGDTEVLLQQSTKVMANALNAGNQGELHFWHQMPHVHPLFQWLPESKQALAMMTVFAEKHLT